MRRLRMMGIVLLFGILLCSSVYAQPGLQSSLGEDLYLLNLERMTTHYVLRDTEWLQQTKPVSKEAMLEDFKTLEYREDILAPGQWEEWRGPELVRRAGGDCEDIAAYVVIRLHQLRIGEKHGFFVSWFTAYEEGRIIMYGHAASVIKMHGSLLIIDPIPLRAGKAMKQVFSLGQYLKFLRRVSNFTAYRIWWWGEPIRSQPDSHLLRTEVK